jgi:hypothetical protein
MKVGFVFECQSQGSDEQVYTYIAKRLCENFEILPENISSLGDKKTVLQESATDVRIMLDNGCEFVFIIWDRMPKWGGTGRCQDHRTELSANLANENIDRTKIIMCCIDEMLESWMIADGRGVTNYFKAISHLSPVFPDHKSKTEQTAPKERLKKYNGRYNETVDNIGIVKLLPDFSRAERCNASFAEFTDAVRRICNNRN